METQFNTDQLAQAPLKMANDILRKCVHCGFCTATCPTYVLLGDELDSPRGRIYQIRDLLQAEGQKPAASVVKHVDRCLTCLSCMTTCPSGVDYMHLVDHARNVIEKTHRRPLAERLLRELLIRVLPNPRVFRVSLVMASLTRALAPYLPGRLRTLAAMAPRSIKPADRSICPGVIPAEGEVRRRVALMPGCAQQVLDPAINAATVRLLTRLGCDVVIADSGCCGALVHHMGREAAAYDQARRNVAAWTAAIEDGGLDAIVINASGCGTTVKDYGHLLKDDPQWAKPAAAVAALARDITEVIEEIGIEHIRAFDRPRVAYHSACSMQHGQKLKTGPLRLLKQAGFDVAEPAEAHLCCGSAGTYNILQPELATKLGQRKARALGVLGTEVIATGNIGCMTQISSHTSVPVVHTVELLDWATGGPKPESI